eukprot:NODE_9_length_47730_cov_0.323718.p21 type:complete len:224 gc:universal NODE_9_length_47730_cov_0.323718:4449-5120(+)
MSFDKSGAISLDSALNSMDDISKPVICNPDIYENKTRKKPVIAWVDGCFDGMHFGHANALRQARAYCDFLIVGVHSDAEIEYNKGPTVMKEKERYLAAAACKWSDMVVPNAPYYTDVDMLKYYGCDFCVHGDDITTTADGIDCYQACKDANMYKEVPRTHGISTTELLGRNSFRENTIDAVLHMLMIRLFRNPFRMITRSMLNLLCAVLRKKQFLLFYQLQSV